MNSFDSKKKKSECNHDNIMALVFTLFLWKKSETNPIKNIMAPKQFQTEIIQNMFCNIQRA